MQKQISQADERLFYWMNSLGLHPSKQFLLLQYPLEGPPAVFGNQLGAKCGETRSPSIVRRGPRQQEDTGLKVVSSNPVPAKVFEVGLPPNIVASN